MPDVDWIRELCLSLPDTTENIQWGEDLCFKVRGKIFTVLNLADGRFPSICFKCSQEVFDELLQQEGVTPAPYVGRYKWVLLSHSNLLTRAKLEELIRRSYALIATKAGKRTSAQQIRKRRRRSR